MSIQKNKQSFENVEDFQYHKEKREKQARKERRKAKARKRNKIIIITSVIVVVILMSPVFQIKTINATQIKKYTQSQIIEKTGIREGMNLVFLSKREALRNFENDPYIESCEIDKQLPNTVNINVKERRVRGYVPYMGSYLYIDEYGRVLDVQTSYTEPLPIVKGLEFSEFKLGETLDVKNTKSFDVIVKIAQMMTKYELLDLVVSIDVSNPSDIHAYSNNVEILLGDISDCDKKIRTMAEVLKKLPEGDRGTLDLRDMSKPIIFKYLT